MNLDSKALPKKMATQLSDLQDKYEMYLRNKHIPIFQVKAQEIKPLLDALLVDAEAVLYKKAARAFATVVNKQLIKDVAAHNDACPENRSYGDYELERVASSGLDGKRGSKDHLALAIKLEMNYGSLMWYLAMRDFLSGDRKWVECSLAFMKVMARGDASLLEDMIERNAEGLKENKESKKEKALITEAA